MQCKTNVISSIPPPRENPRDRTLTFCLAILSIPLLLLLALRLRAALMLYLENGRDWQIFFSDHRWRWAECRYLLGGVDPMDAVRGLASAPVPAMQLPEIAGAFPWAYLLGVLFTFAFLPYPAARALSILLFGCAAAGLLGCGYRFVFAKTRSRALAAFGVLYLLTSHALYDSLVYGNYGLLCGLLLIAAVFTAPTRPVLAGICLLFASMKPQLAALFYLALLIDRNWKPVLIGGLGTLCAWGAAGALCHTSPLTMLYETFAQSTGNFYDSYSFGIFTHSLPRTAGMFLSMAVCALCMALACWWLRRRRESLPHWQLFYYSLPAVFSVCWTYCNIPDHTVLYLLDALVLLCCWDLIRQKGMRLSLLLLVLAALCWMLHPDIVTGFLCQMWDYCVPGQLLDPLFQDLLSWAPPLLWWLFCYLCAAPGRAAERFRALL